MDRERALIPSGFVGAYVTWADNIQGCQEGAAASTRITEALTQEATALAEEVQRNKESAAASARLTTALAEKVQKNKESVAASTRITEALTQEATALAEEVQRNKESAAASARLTTALAEKVQKNKERAAASAQLTAALTQEATALAGHWLVGGTDWPMTLDAEGVPAPVVGWGEWAAAQHVSSESPAARRVAALRVPVGLKPDAPTPPPRSVELPPNINTRIATFLSDPVPFAIVRASTIKDVHDAMRATGCHDAYKTWLETEPRPPRWLGVDMEMNTEAERPSPVMGWAAFVVMRARRTRLLNRGPSVCKRTLRGHTGRVRALAACGGDKLASGSGSGAWTGINIWDVATGEYERMDLPPDGLLGGRLRVLEACAGGKLASAAGKTINIWDVATKKWERQLQGHTGIVRALAACGGDKLASGSHDNTINIWNVATGKCERTLEGPYSVLALAECAEGKLASGSYDNSINIWNVETGACERTLRGHIDTVLPGSVFALAACAGGKLASGSRDMTIKIWDVATGNCERTLEGHTGVVLALAAWPGGKLASSGPGSSDNTIKIWDVATGECECTLEGHTGPVRALVARADGTLASGSYDKTIKIWGDRA